MSLSDKFEIIPRNKIKDDRGWFLKILHGKEQNLQSTLGEIYVTEAKPGGYRANHYHKIAREWFTVIKGKANVILKDLESGEEEELILDSETPQTLYCDKGVAHVFYNASSNTENFILIAYADQHYDPSDTYIFDLIGDNEI